MKHPRVISQMLLMALASVAVLTASLANAQGSMKTKEDGQGGMPKDTIPQKPRPQCLTQLPSGVTGPVAKAVWHVPSPGKVNFCVLAGVSGNYVVATGGNTGGTGKSGNANAATQRAAVQLKTTPAGLVALPITFELRDTRAPHIWEREWDASRQPDEEAPLLSNQSSWVPHTALKFPKADLLEPQSPNTSANLPNAWCVQNLNWAKRPYLVVALSGAGVRNHTDRSEISCHVEFGAPESPTANLQTLVGAPAFPKVTSTPTPTKPTVSPKTPQ
jgi:hypothetical protein